MWFLSYSVVCTFLSISCRKFLLLGPTWVQALARRACSTNKRRSCETLTKQRSCVTSNTISSTRLTISHLLYVKSSVSRSETFDQQLCQVKRQCAIFNQWLSVIEEKTQNYVFCHSQCHLHALLLTTKTHAMPTSLICFVLSQTSRDVLTWLNTAGVITGDRAQM